MSTVFTPVYVCEDCRAVNTASVHADPDCDGAVLYVDDEWICGQCGERIATSTTCAQCGGPTTTMRRSVSVDNSPSVHPETLEIEIHKAVNDARQREGYETLSYDHNLAAIARSHGRNMAHNEFFGHETPDGVTPTHRYDKFGYNSQSCGENIAAITPSALRDAEAIAVEFVDGWLASESHRDTLLRDSWTVEGIGTYYAADGTVFATQNFA